MAKEIKTQIDINASVETVWNALMKFEDYPNWNPFIRKISGEPLKGEKLNVFIQPLNSKGMTFKPTVLIAERNSQFEWQGHLFIPGIFDGRHKFKLQENSTGGCTLFHEEEFGGILSFIYNTQNAKESFAAMNLAMKGIAEGVSVIQKK